MRIKYLYKINTFMITVPYSNVSLVLSSGHSVIISSYQNSQLFELQLNCPGDGNILSPGSVQCIEGKLEGYPPQCGKVM
jgi:hypothetical protein